MGLENQDRELKEEPHRCPSYGHGYPAVTAAGHALWSADFKASEWC